MYLQEYMQVILMLCSFCYFNNSHHLLNFIQWEDADSIIATYFFFFTSFSIRLRCDWIAFNVLASKKFLVFFNFCRKN